MTTWKKSRVILTTVSIILGWLLLSLLLRVANLAPTVSAAAAGPTSYYNIFLPLIVNNAPQIPASTTTPTRTATQTGPTATFTRTATITRTATATFTRTATTTQTSAPATSTPTSTATFTPTNTATPTATTSPTPGAPQAQLFGVEMSSITTGEGLGQITAANISWVRRNGVLWSSIQPTEGGAYDWSSMADLETDLKNASSNGLQVVLIVRSTPEWARKIAGPGPSCGPIAQSKLPAFGNFMKALVARYSVAPYNVKYWEMWNEEDAQYIEGDNIFGCWGDPGDTNYYGGGYYAEMLKTVYPQIKMADAYAQVLVGGLILDCDPRPGRGCSAGYELPPKFLEGILKNNGGSYFDGVSFHAYDWFYGQLGYYALSGWQSAWNTTGPVGIAKARFIKDLLRQYDVTGKFIVDSETALICPTCSNDPVFESTKANYVAQSYAAAIAEGFRANIWYNVFGWNGTGLLDYNLSPLPAYTALKFGQSELRAAAYAGEVVSADIGGESGVKGYKFLRNGRRVWVIWSLDGNTHLINFSRAPLAAWDAMGVSVTSATSMNITVTPLYLEWNP